MASDRGRKVPKCLWNLRSALFYAAVRYPTIEQSAYIPRIDEMTTWIPEMSEYMMK